MSLSEWLSSVPQYGEFISVEPGTYSVVIHSVRFLDSGFAFADADVVVAGHVVGRGSIMISGGSSVGLAKYLMSIGRDGVRIGRVVQVKLDPPIAFVVDVGRTNKGYPVITKFVEVIEPPPNLEPPNEEPEFNLESLNAEDDDSPLDFLTP
jgi:hypothetical protein